MISVLIERCLNIHGTHVTNNSTNNNVVFFCFRFENSILHQQLILDHNALDKRGKNILRPYLLGDKIIQNCFRIDATHYYDNDLLLKQETPKKIVCPRS